jgi:hypothetical protein
MKARAMIVLAMVLALGGCAQIGTAPFKRADGVVGFSTWGQGREDTAKCEAEANGKFGPVSTIRPFGGDWDKAFGRCMNALGYIPSQ